MIRPQRSPRVPCYDHYARGCIGLDARPPDGAPFIPAVVSLSTRAERTESLTSRIRGHAAFGTLTFHTSSHILHRYFVSMAAAWPTAASIVLRLLNMYSLLPHFGQVFFVRSILAVSKCGKSSVEFKVHAGGCPGSR